MTYILTKLRPNQNSFSKSNDFFKWYTPRAPLVEYSRIFGDYLKKLSSARTLREKDREAWLCTQSSSKEVIPPKPKAINVKHKVNTAGTKFHIESRNVTFYDSQETFDVEIRPWYVKIKRCLESKLPVVLQETGMFVSKGIDPTHYNIKFRHAQNVPKQGGAFGDYGVFICLFLYRLAHGIPLDVEDPIKTIIAY
nr:phospholipase-like protein [Tanacetum cinerariifolium]